MESLSTLTLITATSVMDLEMKTTFFPTNVYRLPKVPVILNRTKIATFWDTSLRANLTLLVLRFARSCVTSIQNANIGNGIARGKPATCTTLKKHIATLFLVPKGNAQRNLAQVYHNNC